MKTLVAATARKDVNSVEVSVARAGMELVWIRTFRAKSLTPDIASILVLGLPNPKPLLPLIEMDMPIGLLLRVSDLVSVEQECDHRQLRLWCQRADRFFVENESCSYRLVGILGVLGRLNRSTMGTALVEIWQPEAEEDRISKWLGQPHRSSDAENEWPRLGGDAFWEFRAIRPWYDPRRWI